MSDYSNVNEPSEIKQLLKSKELRESELTPKQKTALFGKGNPNTVLYKKSVRNGKDVVVSRTFGPGETVPEGWEDTPAKSGLVATEKEQVDSTETVFAELPKAGKPKAGK